MLAPGFVDAQVNGGGGVLLNDAPTADGVRTICDAHARFGTTALLPTLITDSPEITAKAVASVKQAIAGAALGCLGLHLEGPFLSPERRGAHDANLMRTMTDADVDEILSLGIDTLLMTLSPERVAPAHHPAPGARRRRSSASAIPTRPTIRSWRRSMPARAASRTSSTPCRR